MTGRRIVVTGGARGIGAAVVGHFLDAGDAVAVLDRSALDRTTVDRSDVCGVVVDLADHEATAAACAAAAGSLGGVDVVVNNAGIFDSTPLLEIDPAVWDAVFAVNVRAMVSVMQALVPLMPAGSAVVNLASMGGKVGEPGQAHYAASKAAVISLTRVAAMEFGPLGIRVNCVCPGYVLTELGAAARDEATVAGWADATPLGRLCSPEEIAGVVGFLAGPASIPLTGEAMNASSGHWMT